MCVYIYNIFPLKEAYTEHETFKAHAKKATKYFWREKNISAGILYKLTIEVFIYIYEKKNGKMEQWKNVSL